MRLCECGCGQEVKDRFARGHNLRKKNPSKDRIAWNKGRGKLAYVTKEELTKLYSEQKLTMAQIGKIYRVNDVTVCRKIKEFKIPTHRQVLREVGREELYDLYWIQRLTATQIGLKYKVRGQAVLERMKILDIPKRGLSETTTGKYNPSWKGGRYKNPQGYIVVWIDKEDPLHAMVTRGNYILEHRLIMARHLDRCLEPWEIVHHKNGIKDDNRLENLKLLLSRMEHIPSIQLQHEVNTLRKEVRLLKWRLNELQEEIKMLKGREVG